MVVTSSEAKFELNRSKRKRVFKKEEGREWIEDEQITLNGANAGIEEKIKVLVEKKKFFF